MTLRRRRHRSCLLSRRARAFAAIICLLCPLALEGAAAAEQPRACTKAHFEAVVDEAAAALRTLNKENKPLFQTKLQTLKKQHGWDHATFLKNAAPFVKDAEIDVYDSRSADLLAKISSMGQEGADAETADCGMLDDLRGHMSDLVSTQKAKWHYMYQKIDAELDSSP